MPYRSLYAKEETSTSGYKRLYSDAPPPPPKPPKTTSTADIATGALMSANIASKVVQARQQQEQEKQQTQQAAHQNALQRVTGKVTGFLDRNVVKPVVATGKVVGNTGSLVAGEATRNSAAVTNSKKALGKSYGESIPGGITHSATGLVEDINAHVVQPTIKQAKEYAHNPGELKDTLLHGNKYTNIYNDAVKSGKVKQPSKFVESGQRTDMGKIIANGGGQKEINDYFTKSQEEANKTTTKMLAEAVGTGAALYGGGEVAGTVAGTTGKALTTRLAENAAAGAVGNVANTVQDNPKASTKDLIKAAAAGGGFGALTAGAGEVLRKVNPLTKVDLTPERLAVINQSAKKAGTLRKLGQVSLKDETKTHGTAVRAKVSKELVDNQFVKPTIEHVPIKSLKIGTDSVGPVDKATVAKYAADIKAGHPINPLVVEVGKDGKILVQDGKHRLEAMKQVGADTAPVVEKIAKSDRIPPLVDSTPIGGYSHSDALAKDYAEMLHSMDTGVKGGQTIPDGEGGYKRTSDHSQFYRDYFKENGRAPSQAAYLEEAHKELASGKAGFGASEDYAKLKAREATMPKPKVKPVAGRPTLTPVGTGTARTSKLAASVEARGVEKKLINTLGDLPGYKQADMKIQAEKATALLAKDEAKAISIARGIDSPPKGLLPESVFTAVEDKAVREGNADLIRQLSNSTLATEATAMGQRIRALAERNPESAIGAIKQISDIRAKAAEKRLGKPIEKVINSTVRDIKSSIKRPTRMDWSQFIESIKC